MDCSGSRPTVTDPKARRTDVGHVSPLNLPDWGIPHTDAGLDTPSSCASLLHSQSSCLHHGARPDYGMGLWWDGSNKNARVYGNRIYDNGSADWTLNVQLGVASSDGSRGGRGGIEIYANRIDGAAYPLGIVTHAGRPTTKQVHVHDNLLILRADSSRVGGADQTETGEMFRPSAGNRFRANTYRVLDPKAAYWAWNGERLTWAQWRALGHDDNGVVERVK
jgi:hypothetical protein